MTTHKGPPVDATALIPDHLLQGESEYETRMLRAYAQEARGYLESFPWCTGIRQLLYGVGVGGVIAVFLGELSIKALDREWLWIVAGDLPTAYFAAELADTPCLALRHYCAGVEAWAAAVRTKALDAQAMALRAEASLEIAVELSAKVLTVRRIVLPVLCPCVSSD